MLVHFIVMIVRKTKCLLLKNLFEEKEMLLENVFEKENGNSFPPLLLAFQPSSTPRPLFLPFLGRGPAGFPLWGYKPLYPYG